MTKPVKGVLLDMVGLDRASATPLYLQLDRQIRRAVLSGALERGDRLPATRQLALDLGVSRMTVQSTYDQLIAEGFLTATTGSGTFVAEIPVETLPVSSPPSSQRRHHPEERLSRRGREISRTGATTRVGMTKPFRPGVPAADLFPLRAWSRLCASALTGMGRELFGYGPVGGYPPLRKAIAAHLATARGVNCDPGQVIVTSGAQQAFALSALALLDRGDVAWGEHPGHTAGRDVLTALGATVIPIPIDSEGLDLNAGRAIEENPKLIFVTPSHQHPLGITMSLRRRLELLKFAEDCRAWVLEDDYDSEFRYSGRPLPALQGLDKAARVIYTGSFSKVLYPSLRLGYLVVPPDLVDTFMATQTLLSHGSSYLPQVALSRFMEDGGFATHIRKMRVAYGERQSLLIDSLRRHVSGLLEVQPSQAGMHLLAWLPDGMDDMTTSRNLWAAEVETVPLSIYCSVPYPRQGLLLGFTGVRPAEIDPGVQRLARTIAGQRRPA